MAMHVAHVPAEEVKDTLEPFHVCNIISASSLQAHMNLEGLPNKLLGDLERAETNYSVGYGACCEPHALNMNLDGIYDDCQDFERRPSWNIVFCENIRLPAFGWLRSEGLPQKILAVSFVHDETPRANVIMLDENKECRVDLSDACFEFCDKYNTYALNHFRDLADWLEAPRANPMYVATVAVSTHDVQVSSIGGQMLIQLDSSRSVSLHKLKPMVQFECRTLNVDLVLDTGQRLQTRFFRELTVAPGTLLGEKQERLIEKEHARKVYLETGTSRGFEEV